MVKAGILSSLEIGARKRRFKAHLDHISDQLPCSVAERKKVSNGRLNTFRV